MRLRVECSVEPPRESIPVRFLGDGRSIEIDEVVDRWAGVGYSYFKVTDRSRNVYIIRHNEIRDEWDLTMFQRAHATTQQRGDGSDSGARAPPVSQSSKENVDE